MSISLYLNEEESLLIKNYADLKGVSVSEFIRNSVLEKIEDEIDLEIYKQAMIDHRTNPVTYTYDEVEEMLR